jgi:hypothetical protein
MSLCVSRAIFELNETIQSLKIGLRGLDVARGTYVASSGLEFK